MLIAMWLISLVCTSLTVSEAMFKLSLIFSIIQLLYTRHIIPMIIPTDNSFHITGADNVILHLFPNPNKEPNRFKLWVNAIGGLGWIFF